MNTDSDCIPGETCGSNIAPLYFLSFIVICTFVMLNLFILVIIQQFDQYYLAEDNVLSKFEKDLMVFKNSWTVFAAPNHCIKIKDNKLVPFFKDLERPLGMSAEDVKSNNDIHKNIVQMDIRADEEGYVYFNELLYKVMKKTYGIKHIRNKKLADYEANTFIKINKIQEKMSKYLISEEKKAIAVNPFLAIMYYKISFKTWLNMAKKRFEAEAKNDNMAGSEQSNEDISVSDAESEGAYMQSEYSYRTFEIESMTSSSAHLGSEESKSSSGIGTIIENEDEENEHNNINASYENAKGRRLFVDSEKDVKVPVDEESDAQDEEEVENDKNQDEVHSDEEPGRKESLKERAMFSGSPLEKRKSSAPNNIPKTSPRIDKDKVNLNIIEEKGDEHTSEN